MSVEWMKARTFPRVRQVESLVHSERMVVGKYLRQLNEWRLSHLLAVSTLMTLHHCTRLSVCL